MTQDVGGPGPHRPSEARGAPSRWHHPHPEGPPAFGGPSPKMSRQWGCQTVRKTVIMQGRTQTGQQDPGGRGGCNAEGDSAVLDRRTDRPSGRPWGRRARLGKVGGPCLSIRGGKTVCKAQVHKPDSKSRCHSEGKCHVIAVPGHLRSHEAPGPWVSAQGSPPAPGYLSPMAGSIPEDSSMPGGGRHRPGVTPRCDMLGPQHLRATSLSPDLAAIHTRIAESPGLGRGEGTHREAQGRRREGRREGKRDTKKWPGGE